MSLAVRGSTPRVRVTRNMIVFVVAICLSQGSLPPLISILQLQLLLTPPITLTPHSVYLLILILVSVNVQACLLCVCPSESDSPHLASPTHNRPIYSDMVYRAPQAGFFSRICTWEPLAGQGLTPCVRNSVWGPDFLFQVPIFFGVFQSLHWG
jgi:hypothetical protein